VGFSKEPNNSSHIGGEQETGVIPFNTEVISPIFLSQSYEGGSEGDMQLPEQYNDEDNEDESAGEEDEGSPTSESADTQETTSPNAEGYVTRSGRISRPPERLQYVAFESLLEGYDYQDEDKWCETDLLAFESIH
jgi:hypothetical protein